MPCARFFGGSDHVCSKCHKSPGSFGPWPALEGWMRDGSLQRLPHHVALLCWSHGNTRCNATRCSRVTPRARCVRVGFGRCAGLPGVPRWAAPSSC
eukprot:15454399-Alexandrium_andersonii.AAC.1